MANFNLGREAGRDRKEKGKEKSRERRGDGWKLKRGEETGGRK